MLLKEAKIAGGEAPFTLNERKLRPSNLTGDVTLGVRTHEVQPGSDIDDGGLMGAMTQLAWERDIDLNATTALKKQDPKYVNGSLPPHIGSASKIRKRATGKNSKVSPSPEGSVPNSAGSRDYGLNGVSDEEQKVGQTKPHASKANINNNSKILVNQSIESMNSQTSLSKLVNNKTYRRNDDEEF